LNGIKGKPVGLEKDSEMRKIKARKRGKVLTERGRDSSLEGRGGTSRKMEATES